MNKIYLVVNFLTLDDNDKLFNTNLAFGRDGRVLAKYRKFHLYGAEQEKLDHPSVQDVSYFETDFGARIGLMICFDSIYIAFSSFLPMTFKGISFIP